MAPFFHAKVAISRSYAVFRKANHALHSLVIRHQISVNYIAIDQLLNPSATSHAGS